MSPESSDFLKRVFKGLINTGKQFFRKDEGNPSGPAEELTDISLTAETMCSSSIIMSVSKGLPVNVISKKRIRVSDLFIGGWCGKNATKLF